MRESLATQPADIPLVEGADPEMGGPLHPEDAPSAVAPPSAAKDYWNLTKPRLSRLAAIISAGGFYMDGGVGNRGLAGWLQLGHVALATFAVSAGAMVLNQYLERDLDSRMHRTRHRPLAARRVDPDAVFFFGIVVSLVGMAWLALAFNPLAGAMGALAVASYVLIYTPLKRVTSLCTVIGAVPGALPPVIGWAAARATIEYEVWLLFAIMFFWQMPHFLALAWVYREDYERAGMPMLPVLDAEGSFTAAQAVLYALGLLFTSLLPSLVGMVGYTYFWAAAISGAAFLWLCVRWLLVRTRPRARTVFFASLAHITFLFLFLALDKY